MSRLDSFIRRLEAQRRMLDWAAAESAGRPGLVLELGLGNGRTYDHLREILPGRDIHVFERDVSPNPHSMPPAGRLVIGDMAETLPAFALRHGRGAALIHVDVTTGVPERDRVLFAWLPEHVAGLAAPDALVLSGWDLDHPALTPVALPEGVPAGRYYAYRRVG
ncbi:class I SAM-dependent methyltransferase [Bosea sp. 124]|uniref:class I SAM-dependent methyltransferase n=1 Tax=Bosea sp. 124 TaxID=2135642 RepID=UPI000D36D7B3|nr:class I SAM-dependent methyltransferase [Bosea sp. 124]PTM42912.1 S-adenosylmethionine-dependent methyltransferase [Bosea sp. 124]